MTLDFTRYLVPELPSADGESNEEDNVLQQCTFEDRFGELVLRRPRTSRREDTVVSLRRWRLQGHYLGRRDSDSGYTSPTDNNTTPNDKRKVEKDVTNSIIKATFTCGTPPEDDRLLGEQVDEIQETQHVPSSFSAPCIRRRSRVTFADERGLSLVSLFVIPQEEMDFNPPQNEVEDDWEDWLSGGQHGVVWPLTFGHHRTLSPPPSPPSLTSSPDLSSDEEVCPYSQEYPSSAIIPAEKKIYVKNIVCRLCFEQPGASFGSFMKRLEEQCVSLENVLVEDTSVQCSVKVKNLSYEKRVSARCTYDGWLSHVDIPAIHVSSGCLKSVYETFAFTVDSPPQATLAKRGPRSAEFAICYEVNGQTYWDNNSGKNYCIIWRHG